MNTIVSVKPRYSSLFEHWEYYLMFSDRNTIYTVTTRTAVGDPQNIAQRYAESLVDKSHEERVASVTRFRDLD